jgi:hypothetical protein
LGKLVKVQLPRLDPSIVGVRYVVHRRARIALHSDIVVIVIPTVLELLRGTVLRVASFRSFLPLRSRFGYERSRMADVKDELNHGTLLQGVTVLRRFLEFRYERTCSWKRVGRDSSARLGE